MDSIITGERASVTMLLGSQGRITLTMESESRLTLMAFPGRALIHLDAGRIEVAGAGSGDVIDVKTPHAAYSLDGVRATIVVMGGKTTMCDRSVGL